MQKGKSLKTRLFWAISAIVTVGVVVMGFYGARTIRKAEERGFYAMLESRGEKLANDYYYRLKNISRELKYIANSPSIRTMLLQGAGAERAFEIAKTLTSETFASGTYAEILVTNAKYEIFISATGTREIFPYWSELLPQINNSTDKPSVITLSKPPFTGDYLILKEPITISSESRGYVFGLVELEKLNPISWGTAGTNSFVIIGENKILATPYLYGSLANSTGFTSFFKRRASGIYALASGWLVYFKRLPEYEWVVGFKVEDKSQSRVFAYIFLLGLIWLVLIGFTALLTERAVEPLRALEKELNEILAKDLTVERIEDLPSLDSVGLAIKRVLSKNLAEIIRLKSIIDGLGLSYFTVDRSLVISEFSPGMEKLTGFKRGDVVNKLTCEQVLNTPYCSSCPLEKMLSGKDSPKKVVRNVIKTNANESVCVFSNYGLIYDPKGAPIGGFCTVYDTSTLSSILGTDYTDEIRRLSATVGEFRSGNFKARVTLDNSSVNAELGKTINELGESLERIYTDIFRTLENVFEKMASVRNLLELIHKALLEPTTQSALIATGIGEISGTSTEIIDNAKLAIEVTRESEKNLIAQCQIWDRDIPLVNSLMGNFKQAKDEIGRISQLMFSCAGVVKGLEDKLWASFSNEEKLPHSGVAVDNRYYQGIFKSLGDLTSFMDSMDNAIARLRATIENTEEEVKAIASDIKEGKVRIENFLSLEKRMIGLLERLISLADGSVWNIDDFKHSIENASSASWETANFIRDAIAGINEIESELKNIAPQIQTGEQRLKKAA